MFEDLFIVEGEGRVREKEREKEKEKDTKTAASPARSSVSKDMEKNAASPLGAWKAANTGSGNEEKGACGAANRDNKSNEDTTKTTCPDNGQDSLPCLPCLYEEVIDNDTGNDNNNNKEKEGMPPLLLNRKPPQYVRQQELPWHRIALEKAAKGFTAREIADSLGCSPTAVQDILRQPQYQKTQADLIRREGDKDYEVCEIIKDNVVSAVKTLKEIMNDTAQSAAYRISAAKELLDRRYGKPNQPINRNTDVDLSQLSDADLIKMLQN